jgi:hypothetical protein
VDIKVSIFVRNTEDKLFEFDNTLQCSLNIANKFSWTIAKADGIDEFDVIYFTKTDTMIPVHKSKSEKEAHFVINAILQKLKEKDDLFQQRKAVKKINGIEETNLLESLERKIRNNYFEVKIEDILKDYRE